MITSHMVKIEGHFKITWVICHFNVPIHKISCFLFVSCMGYWHCMYVCHNVITFIGYLLTTFLDDIEVWCHWPMDFRGYWLLKTPEIIIIGFLLEFSFVWLHPSFNANIVALVPFIFLSFDIMVLEESYEALLINFMTKNVLAPPYPTVSLSLKCDLASQQHQ